VAEKGISRDPHTATRFKKTVDMPHTTYLISGANRGIGRGLAEIFLSRPDTTVVALVRDPSSETSQSLAAFKAGENSKAVVVQYDASLADSATSVINILQAKYSITTLDIVIANSGFIGWRGPSITATTAEYISHFITNTIGPILLLQATLPLLKKSTSSPKFFAISSAIGSTALIPKMQHVAVVPYGMSKAALNHAMLRLSVEHPDVIDSKSEHSSVREECARLGEGDR
jgi:norsolorinic acid ketoreductase